MKILTTALAVIVLIAGCALAPAERELPYCWIACNLEYRP